MDRVMIPSFDEMAKAFEPLIKKVIKQLYCENDFDEMFQIGLIGLYEATISFDPKRGAFPSYAAIKIRGRMLSEIRAKKRHYSRHVYADKIKEQLFESHQDNYFPSDILQRLNSILTPREFLWVKLQYIEDQDTNAIAKKYHVSPHTVRSWKKSAIKKMKKAGIAFFQ
ncbi:sigma-70 family RNA polymerase sigma factor [Terrilactibacillus sp. BCM23-1]|uniref:Sigma-70 family RNA polymerase sigma factor n=1 Tax=Terrilactibacillus tamarindi TaxID=2599694 RepID=A0A6N8CPY3_9BACI|nr:sigma-70 family RNA polymerase sigma factor [Terrilactibacillus tamarindi]MTT32182.1 sigma-70 family RNA polymerase sigma factor [Terrilactibacillus tamarindi]